MGPPGLVRRWRTNYTHLTPTNIVGLDLSLSSTGYYLIGSGISGAIVTNEKLSSMERIDGILARIAELVHEGDFVLIENNAFKRDWPSQIRARRAERHHQILVMAPRNPVCFGRAQHPEEVHFGRGQGREIVHHS